LWSGLGLHTGIHERARIVLAAAGGPKNNEIASKLGICTRLAARVDDRAAVERAVYGRDGWILRSASTI
jgi:hypothetical protein